jgi:hypothetical protein
MHEQTGNNIVEKLTVKRSMEILTIKSRWTYLKFAEKGRPSSSAILFVNWKYLSQQELSHILELKILGLVEKSAIHPILILIPERYNIAEAI